MTSSEWLRPLGFILRFGRLLDMSVTTTQVLQNSSHVFSALAPSPLHFLIPLQRKFSTLEQFQKFLHLLTNDPSIHSFLVRLFTYFSRFRNFKSLFFYEVWPIYWFLVFMVQRYVGEAMRSNNYYYEYRLVSRVMHGDERIWHKYSAQIRLHLGYYAAHCIANHSSPIAHPMYESPAKIWKGSSQHVVIITFLLSLYFWILFFHR